MPASCPANAGQALSRFFEAVEDFDTKEEAMPIDHSKLEAWALCWPADPHPLLFTTKEAAEENRAWFSKNFKTDRHGNLRGEPFVLLLSVKGST